MVELKNRRPMLFTADACYSKKSMDMMCISSFHLDPTASLNSMKRLKTLAETHDAELFYSHDLESFKTDRLSLTGGPPTDCLSAVAPTLRCAHPCRAPTSAPSPHRR